MKFECSQQDITSAINTVMKLSSKNTSLPFHYIYIEAYQYELKLVCTGPEQTVITSIPATVYSEGKILAPSSVLRDILSKMPDSYIQFSLNSNLLMTVSYVNMKYTIQCLASGDFTFAEDIEEDTRFTLPSADLKKCIRRTYFTASEQDARPTLSGILLKCVNGVIDFVSTDGTRVAITTQKINEDISFEIIIPAKFVYDITHSSDKFDSDDSVVSFNGKYIKIKTGKTTLITGLISGKFINYKNIIPHEVGTVMTCDRLSFLSILERAFLLSDEDLYTVKLEIKYSKLYVSSASTAGNAYEEITIQTSGNPITTAFNSKSFIEILRNMEQDQLLFEFTTGTRICSIKPVEPDPVMYLISPIRI